MPAKYPDTSPAEIEAISMFMSILDKVHVKPYLNYMDKIPNYDGYLELTDDNQIPVGKVDVQVKILPEKDASDPKYQCDIDFIEYCDTSLSPVLLVLVDVKNAVAYWLFVSRYFREPMQVRDHANSVCVHIPLENRVARDDTRYVQEWMEIVKEYRVRLQTYPELLEENSKSKAAIKALAQRSSAVLGIEKVEFTNVHKFLDELNVQLDTSFSLVKRIVFPQCWKIGVAYGNYTDTQVTYILYPISSNKNDLQIKEISDYTIDELRKEGLVFSIHYQDNPIKNEPEIQARRHIIENTNPILKKRMLPIRNIVLANEVLIAFMDKYRDCLGIDNRNRYELIEVEHAILRYFPLWIDEALNQKGLRLGLKGYVDPSLILCQISRSEIDRISRIASTLAARGERPSKTFILGTDDFPLPIIIDAIKWLKSQAETCINRLYFPRGFDRLTTGSNWIWSFYTPEELLENSRILFTLLPEVYDSMVRQSFPGLAEEIGYYNGFNELIIVIDVGIAYATSGPTLWRYEVLNKDSKENKTHVYMKGKDELPITGWPQDQDIVINGHNCSVVSSSQSAFDVVYRDYPLFDMVYSMLEKRVKMALLGEQA